MALLLCRSLTLVVGFTLIDVIAGTARAAAAESCAELGDNVVEARLIGLPSTGARVRSSVLVPVGGPLRIEYCRVLGTIGPVDSSAPPISFQANLPTTWNGKAVQAGGGGFNGTLVTGENRLRDDPPDVLPPLAQGYVTFGTDSGHQISANVEIQAFALNEEALVNFAYASYKKTRDVAVALMQARYGKTPAKIYYLGGSEGGREGLAMAQRFPNDYDGVVSVVPVISWTGLQMAGTRNGVMQQNGGWLNATKVALLRERVLTACDNLDGLTDGIVSDYEGCGSVFSAATLRCPTGRDDRDDCLSDAQVRAVDVLHSPYEFTLRLANGTTKYPGSAYGGEDQPGGLLQWVWGQKPAAFPTPAGSGQGQGWYYGSGAIRYFIVRDPKFNPLEFSPSAYADRIRQISMLMDATDPDLSRFAARGGKLIVKENIADYAQSPFAGIDYYKSVVARMGQTAADRFFRLYVTPGANHGGAGVSGISGAPIPPYVDLLRILDDWIDKGRVPPDPLVQTAQSTVAPFPVTATRPMCKYPKYPRYDGSGDPKCRREFYVCGALESRCNDRYYNPESSSCRRSSQRGAPNAAAALGWRVGGMPRERQMGKCRCARRPT